MHCEVTHTLAVQESPNPSPQALGFGLSAFYPMPPVAEKQEGLANVFPQAARHWHEGRHPPSFKMVEVLAASVNDFECRKVTRIQDQTSAAQSEKDQTGFRTVSDFNQFIFPRNRVKYG